MKIGFLMYIVQGLDKQSLWQRLNSLKKQIRGTDNSFKGAIVNRKCQSIYGWSLEIT